MKYLKKIKSLENKKKKEKLPQFIDRLAKFNEIFIPEEHKVK